MIRRILTAKRLREARAARERAQEALRNAVWRKDTRAQHAARQRLREATHTVLKLEVGL